VVGTKSNQTNDAISNSVYYCIDRILYCVCGIMYCMAKMRFNQQAHYVKEVSDDEIPTSTSLYYFSISIYCRINRIDRRLYSEKRGRRVERDKKNEGENNSTHVVVPVPL